MRSETFTVLAASQWFDVRHCPSATRSALGSSLLRNRGLVVGLAASGLMQGAVLYWPPLDAPFHSVQLPVESLGWLVAVASGVQWAEEARKLAGRCARRCARRSGCLT